MEENDLTSLMDKLHDIKASVDDMNVFELLQTLAYNPITGSFTGTMNGLWGETGHGKTRSMVELTKMARKDGKGVCYIDNEGNIEGVSTSVVKKYSEEFIQEMDYQGLLLTLESLQPFDVVILDSVSSLVNIGSNETENKFAIYRKRKEVITDFKKYAKQNNALVFLVLHERYREGMKVPRGGSALHMIDNLWYADEAPNEEPNYSEFFWMSHNVRNFDKQVKMMHEEITYDGTVLEPTKAFRYGTKQWTDQSIRELKALQDMEK